MELGSDDGLAVFDGFDDAVRGKACDGEAGSGLADGVEMEGAAPDLGGSEDAGDVRAFGEMNGVLQGLCAVSRKNFGGAVPLNCDEEGMFGFFADPVIKIRDAAVKALPFYCRLDRKSVV